MRGLWSHLPRQSATAAAASSSVARTSTPSGAATLRTPAPPAHSCVAAAAPRAAAAAAPGSGARETRPRTTAPRRRRGAPRRLRDLQQRHLRAQRDALRAFERQHRLHHQQPHAVRFVRQGGEQHPGLAAARHRRDRLAQHARGQFGEQVLLEHMQPPFLPGDADLHASAAQRCPGQNCASPGAPTAAAAPAGRPRHRGVGPDSMRSASPSAPSAAAADAAACEPADSASSSSTATSAAGPAGGPGPSAA